MNSPVQSQPPQEIELVLRVTVPAANVLLEGLSKLSIERAGGLYRQLIEARDYAVMQANSALPTPPTAPPTAPPDPSHDTH